MSDHRVPPDLRAELLVGGPEVCVICGRTFTRGGMAHDAVTGATVSMCMWCIAGWLEDMTGWAITDQMRGWLVARQGRRHAAWVSYTPAVDAQADPEPT